MPVSQPNNQAKIQTSTTTVHITTPPALPQKEKGKKKKGIFRSTIEFVAWLCVIIIISNLIHKFIFHPFYVIGVSMEPSFQDGNYLFVEKLSYRFSTPQRGDVIIFTPPWDAQNQSVEKRKSELGALQFTATSYISRALKLFAFPAENLSTREYIKRIIGLPSETIEITSDSKIIITNPSNPEGKTLPEPYIAEPTDGTLKLTLGADEFFVLGDNRMNSSDSRGTITGKATNPHTVPRSSIQGRVFIRLWPPGKFNLIEHPDYT